MYLLTCVLDDPSKLTQLLDAWHEVGIQGVTILESTGLHRHRWGNSPDLPSYLGFARLVGSTRAGNQTLLALIEDREVARRAAAATERVVGDLSHRHTAILWLTPVAEVWGLPKRSTDAPEATP